MAADAQVKMVADLLLLLDKTVRAVKIYPPSNPHCREFVTHLHQAFSDLLAHVDPFLLQINRTELAFEGESVYSAEDRRDNLAFVLYKDGLRALGFNRGLDREELRELVQGFNRDFTVEYLDDDVATYLWERDLPHVFFHLSEDYLNDSLPEGLRVEAEAGEIVRRVAHLEPCVPGELPERILGHPPGEGVSGIPLRRPLLGPGHLALTDGEVVRLRQLQSGDDRHVFYEEMLEVVLSIFAQETGEEHVRTYFSLFRSLLESFFTSGSLAGAVTLLQRLNRAAVEPGPAARHLRLFIADLGSGDLPATLGRSLEHGSGPDPDELSRLLALFPATSIPGLTQLLGTLNSMKWRKIVCRALAQLGAQDLALLAGGLQDGRWYVVRNLAYTLGMIGSRGAIPHLARLVAHPDARVRKEALRGLARLEEPEATRCVLQALRHDDERTRLHALQALPKTAPAEIARDLARIIESPAFAQRRLPERVEFSRAFGRLAGDDAVPALEERLVSRAWFGNRRRREEQHLAAVALIARDSAPARAALTRGLPAVDSENRRLIESFLRGRMVPPEQEYPRP